MRNDRAKLQILVAACVWFFLLCTTALNSDAAVPPNQLMITFGSLSERETALFVARDYGIFAKHGLDVRLVHVRNGAVALSALASGDAQFYLGAATGSTLGAIAGGLDAVFVTSLIHKLEGTFVVNPAIKSPAELRAKPSVSRALAAASGCARCWPSSTGAWSRRRTK